MKIINNYIKLSFIEWLKVKVFGNKITVQTNNEIITVEQKANTMYINRRDK